MQRFPILKSGRLTKSAGQTVPNKKPKLRILHNAPPVGTRLMRVALLLRLMVAVKRFTLLCGRLQVWHPKLIAQVVAGMKPVFGSAVRVRLPPPLL